MKKLLFALCALTITACTPKPAPPPPVPRDPCASICAKMTEKACDECRAKQEPQ